MTGRACWRWWGAVALVGALGACGKAKPVPPEGSGIARPVVDEALAPDFRFRWPSPAEVMVTLRMGTDEAKMVSRARLTLGPPDADGRRRLTQSAFEAVGGEAAELVALGLSMTMREQEILIAPDGTTVDPEAGALWAIFVEGWLDLTELELGAEQTFPGGTDGVPEGVELVVRRRASNWDGAARLGYRLTATSPKGQDNLRRQMNLGARHGPPRWIDTEVDLEPRTMQPILVVVRTELEGDRSFAMHFEFDWRGDGSSRPGAP